MNLFLKVKLSNADETPLYVSDREYTTEKVIQINALILLNFKYKQSHIYLSVYIYKITYPYVYVYVT